ncbi:MAG: hypothetical protein K0R60_10 [Microbacterium sp.]|nr:hypothetical protein [Microbacterium sp.]
MTEGELLIAVGAVALIAATMLPVAWVWLRSLKFAPIEYRSEQTRDQRMKMQVTIVLAWAYSFVPALVQRFTTARRANTVADVEALSGLASTATIALLGCLVLWCLFTIVTSVRGGRIRLGALTIVTLPFAYNIASTVANAQPLPNNVVASVAVILALALCSVRLENLRVIPYLLAITAGASLVLGALFPHIGLMAGQSGATTTAEKGILFDSLLAGVYNHSNVLGTMLILGLPSVLLLRRQAHIVVIVAITGFALVWSSSRTSVFSLLAALAGTAVMALLTPRARSAWAIVSVVGALCVVVTLPLITHEAQAFSSRGQIWAGSLSQAAASPITGGGYGWYGHIAEFSNSLIAVAFNGHNLFVHAATTGGALYLLVLAILFIGLLVAAIRFATRGALYPYVFLLAYAVISTLEVVARYRDLDPAFWVVVAPIAVFIFSSADLKPRAPESGSSRGSARGASRSPMRSARAGS